jgi:hypothetical protein
MAAKKRKCFPLLIYKPLAQHWRTPAFLLIPAGIVLWWAAGINPHLNTRYRWAALGVSVIGLVIFIYTGLARRASICCTPDHFTLRGPIYPVVFSYRRIKDIRPVDFATIYPPTEEKRARWRLYRDLWGKTAVVVDLKGYPLPQKWLKLWFSSYLFHPKETALVLLVDEWMSLVRQIETQANVVTRG